MGRAERRQAIKRERKLLMEMETTPQEKMKVSFFRNGITEADVQKAYKQGAKDGRKHAEDFAFHTIYAAFLITMIDHRGMDQEEAVDLLREIDNQVILCVEDQELTEEAYQRTGVELNWKDAIDRIEQN